MISLIFAMDINNLIGKDNDLPWHYSEDLKYFKAVTSGKKVVMGENTFFSIVNRIGKPLPNRENYVATLANDPSAIGILPQPFATVACKQNESLKEAFDLNEAWDAAGKGTLVTGVTIAKKDYIEANPEIIEEFMDEHEDSIEFANEHTEDAAALVAETGIVEKAPIAQAALPKCNLRYIEGEQMQTALSGYLEVLFEQNPESVGGALPENDFYYIEADED